MTPETIKAAIHETNYKSDDEVRFDELEIILTRILCPAPAAPLADKGSWYYECGCEKLYGMPGRCPIHAKAVERFPRFEQPAARPDSAGEGGKDRAGAGYPLLYHAAKAVCEAIGRSAIEPEKFEKICAVISAYGDELLEKAAEKVYRTMNHECAWPNAVLADIASLKSSPTGATHV